jgi:cell division protein FtsA
MACANSRSVKRDEIIEVPSAAGDGRGRQVLRHTLAEVVEMRYAELFELIKAELQRSGFLDSVAAGIVLTGGASQMEGLIELAEAVFDMPVRLGTPQQIKGLEEIIRNPVYATGVGLLLHSAKQVGEASTPINSMGIGSVFSTMKTWFQKNF